MFAILLETFVFSPFSNEIIAQRDILRQSYQLHDLPYNLSYIQHWLSFIIGDFPYISHN